MTDTLILAFGVGLLSAVSLPLGTFTSAFWRPGDRVIAFLMSFGGGALLAALTIDLAGPALAKGHFYWLAAGCIAGGILFVVLDQLVNRHGGFLRKVSTTIFHLRLKKAQRFRRVLSRLRRLGVFSALTRDEARELTNSIKSRFYREGASIFQDGDAMLTMIAQTMLPEAFFKGGSITGFATLLGFLAAIFFKTLQGPGAGH